MSLAEALEQLVRQRPIESRPGDYCELVDGLVCCRRADGTPVMWMSPEAYERLAKERK